MGAKTGAVNEYVNYPDVAKRINKATGGTKAKMPYFFQYTKNGRSSGKPKEKYAKQNKSTMNRICAAFDDIGNIDMNFAGIPPFNYQMLMSEPWTKKNSELVQTFFALDGMSISAEIALAETPPHERSSAGMYEMLAEIIRETLEENFGTLEECYPYIVKALFAGDNWKKPSHKKMFWRIFGDIAVRNLERNLQDYILCPDCYAKIPAWSKDHNCPKNTQGFFVCVDCGKQCIREGSRQCRCAECQTAYRDEAKRIGAIRKRLLEKESTAQENNEAGEWLNRQNKKRR